MDPLIQLCISVSILVLSILGAILGYVIKQKAEMSAMRIMLNDIKQRTCRICKRTSLGQNEVICSHCQLSVLSMKVRSDKKKEQEEEKKNAFILPVRILRLED